MWTATRQASIVPAQLPEGSKVSKHSPLPLTAPNEDCSCSAVTPDTLQVSGVYTHTVVVVCCRGTSLEVCGVQVCQLHAHTTSYTGSTKSEDQRVTIIRLMLPWELPFKTWG